ncbi:MAG: sugar phosphate isomerase/epimerase [Lentisphaeria bacterium]|nr:sugar phosphate isomerase/epimerase [Lentisphaeria bacterium]
MKHLDRRVFLQGAGSVVLGGVCARSVLRAEEAEAAGEVFPVLVGVCTGVDRAAALKEAGADYVEEGVRRLLVPDQPEAAFASRLEKAKAAPLPTPACNGFLPGELKCVGPDPKTDAVLAYAETAFRRARQAGVEIIVFGSGGARRIPDGFDPQTAAEQFADLLRRMGPLAQPHGVTVAIEPLRRQECNFINTVRDGAAMVETVNHPAVRLLADIYHMLHNGEAPEDLRRVGSLLVHTHVAEKAGRTAPGVAGEDLSPFLTALRATGYRGRMSIEGKWEIGQLPQAFATMRRQSA